jgi:uncharacterized protein (TIGR00251 family)
VRVRVTPRSSRNELGKLTEEVLRVKLQAPPVEGEANRALLELFAGLLDVPRSSVEILAGHRSRLKTLRVRGLTARETARRLLA